jgi:hypothetical protein
MCELEARYRVSTGTVPLPGNGRTELIAAKAARAQGNERKSLVLKKAECAAKNRIGSQRERLPCAFLFLRTSAVETRALPQLLSVHKRLKTKRQQQQRSATSPLAFHPLSYFVYFRPRFKIGDGCIGKKFLRQVR